MREAMCLDKTSDKVLTLFFTSALHYCCKNSNSSFLFAGSWRRETSAQTPDLIPTFELTMTYTMCMKLQNEATSASGRVKVTPMRRLPVYLSGVTILLSPNDLRVHCFLDRSIVYIFS